MRATDPRIRGPRIVCAGLVCPKPRRDGRVFRSSHTVDYAFVSTAIIRLSREELLRSGFTKENFVRIVGPGLARGIA